MATDETVYITYLEAVVFHFELMAYLGETRFGVFDRSLVESALARPQQAAVYGNADLIMQAATLCFGLVKNHPWVGGNKRTATALVERFLRLNGLQIIASSSEILELVYAIESDRRDVEQIDVWLRQHTKPHGL